MKKIRANFTDAHAAYVYEDICIEEMWEMNAMDTWDFHFDKAGMWRNGNTEIDIAALDKAGQVEWKRQERKNHFILFSVNGFTEELAKLSEIRKDLILSDSP